MAEGGFELRSDSLKSLGFFTARGSLLGKAQSTADIKTDMGGLAPSV